MSPGAAGKLVISTASKLHSDYVAGRLTGFLRRHFSHENAVAEVAAKLDASAFARARLAAILHEGNTTYCPSDAVRRNIELLERPSTLCVFAGQQTAIMLGPMYTVYKALAAAKLAAQFEVLLNRPVIPCFWMATDDHDFAEVSTAYFLDRSGQPRAISYSPIDPPNGLPISEIVLDDTVTEMMNSIASALIDTEFKPALVAVIAECYQPGVKLSDAFGQLFNRLLGKWGIVLVNPNFPGMKNEFSEIFLAEIRDHHLIHEIYSRRSAELMAAGYHVQVHKKAEKLNLFYHTPRRQGIIDRSGQYLIEDSGRSLAPDELAQLARETPEKFSPNVLLRPIAQCRAFPTLCQVTGPSELAYFAQIEPLFEHFDVAFPILFPRPGLTIMEPHIARLAKRYPLDFNLLRTDPDRAFAVVAQELFPSQQETLLDQLKDRFLSDIDGLIERLRSVGNEAVQQTENFKKRLDFELKELARKLTAIERKRHEEIRNQVKRAHDFLFPLGQLQERVLSPLYYVNKFGNGVLDNIHEALDTTKGEHLILSL